MAITSHNTFSAFREEPLDRYLASRLQNVYGEIDAKEEEYVQNVSTDEYLDYLEAKGKLETASFDVDGISQALTKGMIPSEYFPHSFLVDPGKRYEKTIVVVHVPFSGNQTLLRLRATTYTMSSTPEIWVDESDVCFEIISFNDEEVETVKRQLDAVVKDLVQQVGFVNRDIEKHNAGLRQNLKNHLERRRADIAKRNKLSSGLGIPLKERKDLPGTWSIPVPAMRKKIEPQPPTASKPEPTLAEADYYRILQILQDGGKMFETHPSSYLGKDEEALRDLLLFILQPHFVGSATGEAFNKSGKTDILLRFQNTNAFVAECKVWGGKILLHETIDQLLSYLTWRDSKAAVILFVRNKDMEKTVATAKTEIPAHPLHKALIREATEGWIEYRFKMGADNDRDVHIAFLLFHLPE